VGYVLPAVKSKVFVFVGVSPFAGMLPQRNGMRALAAATQQRQSRTEERGGLARAANAQPNGLPV
jgi:hypothetical protein